MHPLIQALEDRRRRENITADAMLKRSGVSASTHAAWKRGGPFTSATLAKCESALDELVAERDQAAPQ